MKQPTQQLLEGLTVTPPPLVVGHVTPDADCLTSMFALALGIREATGQSARCILPAGSMSQKLGFLIDFAGVQLADLEHCLRAKILAVCDTAKESRANVPPELKQVLRHERRIINIDHHTSNTLFGDLNYVDEHAGSAAELIYRIFKLAGWTLTATVSTLLYTGIHADTVGFSTSGAGAETFKAAADLADHGADVHLTGDRLWRSLSLNEFQLRRVVYDNTRISPSGRIAYSTATHDEIAAAGCNAADIDDQVEIPRSLAGAQIAILLSEGHRGRIRINLRSKSNVSVLELARQIGGGGHHAAAGAIMNGSLEEVQAKLIPLADAYLDQHSRGK